MAYFRGHCDDEGAWQQRRYVHALAEVTLVVGLELVMVVVGPGVVTQPVEVVKAGGKIRYLLRDLLATLAKVLLPMAAMVELPVAEIMRNLASSQQQ